MQQSIGFLYSAVRPTLFFWELVGAAAFECGLRSELLDSFVSPSFVQIDMLVKLLLTAILPAVSDAGKLHFGMAVAGLYLVGCGCSCCSFPLCSNASCGN